MKTKTLAAIETIKTVQGDLDTASSKSTLSGT